MDPITPWKRLTQLLHADRREIGHIYLYSLVGGAISLSVPLGVQAIINLISGGQIASSWGVLIAFVTIGVGLTGVLQVMQLALTENIQQRLFARSAFEFAHRLPRFSGRAMEGRYAPELVNRFFDTITVQKGLSKLLLDVPLAALQIILSLILLTLYHPFFIAFGALLILMLYLIFRFTGRIGLRTSLKESMYKYEVAHWLEEVGRGMTTFKLAGTARLPLDRADELVDKYVRSRKAHFAILVRQYSAMVVFKVIMTLSLLLLGGLLVMGEQMNIGQFVAAEIVIIMLMSAVEKLISNVEVVYDVLTAVEKIGSVTDLELERTKGLHLLSTDPGRGLEVELSRVVFRSHWNGHPILSGIDLRVRPGEKICISGPNGSGKTTLLNIISGTVEVDEGGILLDGHPANSLDLEHVRSIIGENLNYEHVFTGTILENIRVGRSWVTDAQVLEACNATALTDQLAGLPDGVLTEVDPQGSRLPKSVVKRITQARCIVGGPRLILFEDGLQDWNTQERERILGWLCAPERPWTLIAVSNDPWFQTRCDRAFTLVEGKLEASGHA